ncbi:MFS transporter [Psychrobacter sp. YP14]|uniref:MFS transporter n=1 Tax=Psychrobacter sp. YP14 TaxID=2203895 RepID=UPI000D7E10CB|nr:MFS transporter [Psychrobacter sp. YP14]AWT49161.1 MFS transporter [Psychrobacter sp. YP14]
MSTTTNRKPWVLLASIYVTQYIGLAFIFASSIAIMRDMQMPLDKIALLNIIALPLLLKILYAPFIDLMRPSFMRRQLQGRYRSWLLTAQFLMMVLLVIIGMLDIAAQFCLMIALMLVYALAVSVQDVAIDGLANKIFVKEERQRANSVQFSGNLVGNIIGGGLILMAYSWLGWQGSLLVLALLTGIAWLQLLRYTEPSLASIKEVSAIKEQIDVKPVSSQELEKSSSLLSSLINLLKNMWQFIKQNKAWFVLLIVYPIGFSAGFALLNPILVDAKWSFADIGFVTKVFGSVVGVISALSASILIDKMGRVRTLLFLTAAQALVLALFLPLSYGYTNKLMVYGAVTAYFLVNPALMATVATIAMDKASIKTAKATFFTLQLGTFSFMGFVCAAVAMTAANTFGYSKVLMASTVLTFIIVLFMRSKQAMFNS